MLNQVSPPAVEFDDEVAPAVPILIKAVLPGVRARLTTSEYAPPPPPPAPPTLLACLPPPPPPPIASIVLFALFQSNGTVQVLAPVAVRKMTVAAAYAVVGKDTGVQNASRRRTRHAKPVARRER